MFHLSSFFCKVTKKNDSLQGKDGKSGKKSGCSPYNHHIVSILCIPYFMLIPIPV